MDTLWQPRAALNRVTVDPFDRGDLASRHPLFVHAHDLDHVVIRQGKLDETMMLTMPDGKRVSFYTLFSMTNGSCFDWFRGNLPRPQLESRPDGACWATDTNASGQPQGLTSIPKVVALRP